LIDIREPEESYSAGDFVADASRLIEEITQRGKLPILAGGTHFYFDALLKGLPAAVPRNDDLYAQLDLLSTDELYARITQGDPRRAAELDPKNRRRLIRALEIVVSQGSVPERSAKSRLILDFGAEWILIDPPREELRARIDARLASAFERGLIEEVERIRGRVGDTRLKEFGLEYRLVGEYLRGERTRDSLLPALSAKLWQYARRQKAWLRKLKDEAITAAS
jgi:tRNA dimethylallyltransferase